jgi:hypothetical protein
MRILKKKYQKKNWFYISCGPTHLYCEKLRITSLNSHFYNFVFKLGIVMGFFMLICIFLFMITVTFWVSVIEIILIMTSPTINVCKFSFVHRTLLDKKYNLWTVNWRGRISCSISNTRISHEKFYFQRKSFLDVSYLLCEK